VIDRGALRAAYAAFLRPGRILLTGHSHQAWPDAVRAAMGTCFDEAADFVDDKWGEAVFPRIDAVGRRILVRLGFDAADPIAFGRSTHELCSRLLSCFPRGAGLRVVTTTGEFHSLHRQLRRLEEEGAEITWIEASPRASLAERLVEAIHEGVHVVAASCVLFEDATVVRDVGAVISRAVACGAIPLVDAYHAFNVVPMSWGPDAKHAYVVSGGYKYAQFGEGLCFMRFPATSSLRPVDTGWFADFAHLAGPRTEKLQYGDGGARFAGATFDPTPFYRAGAALDVFDAHGLDVRALRAISSAQTSRISLQVQAKGFDLASPVDDELRGGFVAVRVNDADRIVSDLRKRNVFVDSRGACVRLGPAPYLTDDEIDAGVAAFIEAATAT
jgi:kynureninase